MGIAQTRGLPTMLLKTNINNKSNRKSGIPLRQRKMETQILQNLWIAK